MQQNKSANQPTKSNEAAIRGMLSDRASIHALTYRAFG
jgi:hypothetical protein